MQALKIVVVGSLWHGSDCTGIARGFRDLGHMVEQIGPEEFLPRRTPSLRSRLVSRALSKELVLQFNRYLLGQVELLRPDIVLVFKGTHVRAETLSLLSKLTGWLVNFYPDVSFMSHRGLEPEGFKFYDHIFTTKRFGVQDFEDNLGLTNVSFLPHGFDPHVHRPVPVTTNPDHRSEVSFLGTWSPAKEKLLSPLAQKLGDALRIWGGQWERCRDAKLRASSAGYGLMGDFYAQAICSSKINLGLLSERRPGASSGDRMTSRSFQIPACNAFLLHERTDEVLEYFVEGSEIECFESAEEALQKIHYYLEHDEEREEIARAGYQRTLRDNPLSRRCEELLKYYLKSRAHSGRRN